MGDKIEETRLCTGLGICDCETFLKLPQVEGCSKNLVTGTAQYGNYSVERFCAKTCGCLEADNEEKINEILKKGAIERFEEAYSKHCTYATNECEEYVSNLYACGKQAETDDSFDPILREAIFVEGRKIAFERAKLGDQIMHRFDKVKKTDGRKLEFCSSASSLDFLTPNIIFTSMILSLLSFTLV